MAYKHEQTTVLLRLRNSIRAFKILDIKGNNLIIRNNFNKDKTVEFEVLNPNNYNIGDYVDMIFCRTGSNSHRIELIGHTPLEFIPDNRQDII